MIWPQIVFGALEILFNVPARTAQLQAKRFGWPAMKVRQVTVGEDPGSDPAVATEIDRTLSLLPRDIPGENR
jgi:hypothetical protein